MMWENKRTTSKRLTHKCLWASQNAVGFLLATFQERKLYHNHRPQTQQPNPSNEIDPGYFASFKSTNATECSTLKPVNQWHISLGSPFKAAIATGHSQVRTLQFRASPLLRQLRSRRRHAPNQQGPKVEISKSCGEQHALDTHQPEEQHGFRSKYRLEEHLHTANLFLDKATAHGIPVWLVSLDLSIAFDRVHWPTLWSALRAEGISDHMSCQNCMRVNQEKCMARGDLVAIFPKLLA